MPPARRLAQAVEDARERTLCLVADLTDEQLLGPRLAIVNPLRWEIGHVAWFQEKWVLRHALKRRPIRADADALYDSMAIPHDVRWDLPLPGRGETLAYVRAVRDGVLDLLRSRDPTPEEAYFVMLSVLHEDMHTEAFTYTRQTLGYPGPQFPDVPQTPADGGGPLPGDASFRGGAFVLGATPDEPFVFDNEKWAHPVEVAPFRLARAPVTQSEFAAFVEDGGYRRRELWSDAGWEWRTGQSAACPVYWRRAGDAWERRDFDRWVPLEAHRPVLHVSWYEAEAYCRWAGRRLPTEAEWEYAAAWDGAAGRKRRFPWGDEPPSPERANLDWRGMGCVDVGALPAGNSAAGCRQMIGNAWEWTADDFRAYPGFRADPYAEYSEPWFHTHKVLRGGCWATRSRLIRNTWRNFYRPERRDVWCGFRTAAL
ncbi:MAG TPA: selenoneine synthase SenA [Armatimonadota bacterium]|nr:selenoneine synthase SenA [Armatimonadota bacterium]